VATSHSRDRESKLSIWWTLRWLASTSMS
jgi:hypothetical protein